MVKFLERKSTELGNRKASQRALSIDSQPGEKTSIRVKTGDKIFRVQIPASSGEDEDDSLDGSQEKTYVGQLINDQAQSAAKKSPKSRFPAKECAIRCGFKHPQRFALLLSSIKDEIFGGEEGLD